MSFKYTIAKSEKSNEILLSFDGDILGESTDLVTLYESLDGYIKKERDQCVINLSMVKYMDSSGLGILIKILTKFRNAGGEVFLEAISDPVNKLLLMTKLNSIFEIK